MKINSLLSAALLSLPLCLQSWPGQPWVDQPWLDDLFSPRLRFAAGWQYYRKLDTSGGSDYSPVHSQYLSGGAALCFTPQWEAAFDLSLVNSTLKDFYFNSFELKGQRLWLDDVDGDPVSLSTTFALAFSSQSALDDPSYFHHSICDGSAVLSLGKEVSRGDNWIGHYWANLGVGMGVKGDPWATALLAIDQQFCGRHQFALSAQGLAGFGGHALKKGRDFPGYAFLSHRSLDLAASYGYRLASSIFFKIEYGRRFYARYCPLQAQYYTFSFVYPLDI